jgi:3-oxoacyl-[acyl-carrier-protein] synthase-1
MRRVVVTGIGIVSSIGNNSQEVLSSLKEAKSGVIAAPDYTELGFRCQVHAAPIIDWESLVDRRAARFLAPGTAYAHIAMDQAIADSGLSETEVSDERTGLIVGSGGASNVVSSTNPKSRWSAGLGFVSSASPPPPSSGGVKLRPKRACGIRA